VYCLKQGRFAEFHLRLNIIKKDLLPLKYIDPLLPRLIWAHNVTQDCQIMKPGVLPILVLAMIKDSLMLSDVA